MDTKNFLISGSEPKDILWYTHRHKLNGKRLETVNNFTNLRINIAIDRNVTDTRSRTAQAFHKISEPPRRNCLDTKVARFGISRAAWSWNVRNTLNSTNLIDGRHDKDRRVRYVRSVPECKYGTVKVEISGSDT